MNSLAALQLDVDLAASIHTSQSAVAEARAIQYPKGEALALMQAGMAVSRQRNYKAAIEFYERALDLREKLRDKEGVGVVHHKLGNAYYFLGKYPDALLHYNQAIEIRTVLGDEMGVADLYTNTGAIYGLLGDYSQALKSYMNALKVFEKHKVVPRIATVFSNIGTVYYEQHIFDDALDMHQRALEIRKGYNNKKEISNSLNNIGLVFHDQGKFTEAQKTHEKALAIREQIGDKANIAISLSSLADVYKALGSHAVALDYYTRALFLFEELDEKRGMVSSYYNVGELHFIKQEYDKAAVYLNKAIELAEETGLKDHLREAYEHMAKIYAQIGNYKDAYGLNVRVIELDKEISNAETSKLIAQITMRHEIEQKERDTELERTKNAELTKAYNSLEEEKKRSEQLLLNILPEEVAEELKQNGKATARFFDNVTVMFTDFKGFTTISEKLTPQDLVNELHECFKGFDEIIAKYNIEKIKTVGDAYLAASGLPTANENHAKDMIKAAIEIRDFMKRRREENADKETFEVRIGVHSGHVVAGIVGVTKFAYDIWGDTVNTAARMEQNSEAGKINVSQTTYEIIRDSIAPGNGIAFTYRGEIEAKNKGKLKMYFVN